jgi:MoxR-like ATPase
MITVTPAEAYKEIVHCIKVGLVALVTGSPGSSKSSLVRQIAKDYKLKLIDFRLSSRMPEDISGYPMRTGDKATFCPFDVFPLETDQIPEGYNGWLLFFDEFTSANKAMQAAA